MPLKNLKVFSNIFLSEVVFFSLFKICENRNEFFNFNTFSAVSISFLYLEKLSKFSFEFKYFNVDFKISKLYLERFLLSISLLL